MPFKDPEKRREAGRRYKEKARLEGRAPKIYKAQSSYARFRNWKRKSEWIKRLGGCCSNCSYSGSNAALDFDHIKSEDKEFDISPLLASGTDEAIEVELKKCQILCANCHREKTKIEGLLKKASTKVEELKRGDLVEIVWTDVLEDATGAPEDAKVSVRITFGIFVMRKPGLGGSPPFIVISSTTDDPDISHQSGWTAFPEGMILSIKFIRGKPKPRSKARVRELREFHEQRIEVKEDGLKA